MGTQLHQLSGVPSTARYAHRHDRKLNHAFYSQGRQADVSYHIFTGKDDLFENLEETTVLVFEMFTSGFSVARKNRFHITRAVWHP